MIRYVLFSLLALVLVANPAAGKADSPTFGTFTGKVVGIKDGDSILVMHNGMAEELRLNGIDCPERRQAFGNRAKQATSQLAFEKEIEVRPKTLDRYGRTVADVLLPDGTNLNQELVRQGWCWWFRKYSPNDETLRLLEEDARTKKLGLWVDPNPVAPWDFRHYRATKPNRKKGLESDLGGLLEGNALGLSSAGVAGESPTVESGSAPGTSAATGEDIGLILGNRRSHIYHRPDCPNYSEIAERNRVPFLSEEAAIAAGYRLARNCP